MQLIIGFVYLQVKTDNCLMKILKDLIDEAHQLVPKITYNEFNELSSESLVTDVREPTEVDGTQLIPGAINVPRGLIEMKLAPGSENLTANTSIVVYCGGGSRAALAGKTLKELGFNFVQNLEGGFRSWKENSG